MAEFQYRVGPGVTIGGDEAMTDARNIQAVWLWDIGPELPTKPAPPERPARGDPVKDIEYKLAAEKYEVDLRQYEADMISYHTWNRQYAGPYMERMWSENADSALKIDAEAVADGRQTRRRWFIASRTRGYRDLKNQGLPEGFAPGRYHAEMLKREAAGEADYRAARRADPVFGMEAGA